MKKKYFIAVLGVVILVLSIGFKKVKANSNNNEPVNLLDLNNIVIYDYSYQPEFCGTKIIATKQSIKVKEDVRYTFVVDKGFYTNQSWSDLDQYRFPDALVQFYDTNNPSVISEGEVELIPTEDYFYGTFIATYDNLIIASIPIEKHEFNPRSSKIMLFEGTIDQFSSFTGYNTNYEPNEGVFIMDYDNQKSIQELIELFVATDDIDGDVSHNIVLTSDGLSPYTDVLGDYMVSFMVCDEATNKSFYNLTIKLVDITPPVITGHDYYEVEVGSNSICVDYIRYNLSAYDNYCLKFPEYIEIIEDNFTPNKNKVGEYKVIYKATDTSNNVSTYEVTVKNMDTVLPTLEGPSELYRYTTDPILTHAEIRNYFVAQDNVDGNLNWCIEVNGEYSNIPGTYDISIEVADSSGNSVSKILKLHVVDGTSPTFHPNELVLTFAELENMTSEDIVDWLTARISGSSDVEILLNETNYKRSNHEKMYIYYGYTLDNKVMYGRITINPSGYFTKTSSIIGVILIVFNALFLIIQYKKRKY